MQQEQGEKQLSMLKLAGEKIIGYPLKATLLTGFCLYAGAAVALSFTERLIYQLQRSCRFK